jgi:hypothetical protein
MSFFSFHFKSPFLFIFQEKQERRKESEERKKEYRFYIKIVAIIGISGGYYRLYNVKD